MTHPDENQLALLAGDDISWWEAFRLRQHVRHCARCAGKLESFEITRADLSHLSAEGLPEGLDWSRMEREMRGNIHLAVDAGNAIRRVPQFGQRLDWRAGLALTVLTGVVITGWFLNAPRRPVHLPVAAVEAGHARVLAVGAGVELRTGSSRGMTLLAPKEASYSVDARGSVSARSVDESTGQVTIANVSFE